MLADEKTCVLQNNLDLSLSVFKVLQSFWFMPSKVYTTYFQELKFKEQRIVFTLLTLFIDTMMQSLMHH